jgi:polar amino acid transport system permease protein
LAELIDYTIRIMPTLLQGTLIMIELFALTLLFSLPLGLPVTLGSTCRFRVVRFICKCYIWIFRGTPLLLQLFFFYFMVPILWGIRIGPFPTAVITFVLNYAAYFAEIYRGGMNSIDAGQYEAAHSLGLTKHQTMMGIIVPQTLRVVLPPVTNEAIVLIKDTALVSCIGVYDLMRNSKVFVSRDVNLTAYVIAGAIYLLFTFLMTVFANYLERRVSKYDSKGEW